MRKLAVLAPVWAVAALAAVALARLGFPASALIAGIVVFYAAGRSRLDLSTVPSVTVVARSLIGAAAGSLVTWSALRSLGPVLAWASLVAVGALVAGGAIGVLVAARSGMSRHTAVTASMPGGLSEMVAVAQESELDVEVVVAAHLARRLAMIFVAIAVVVTL